MAMAQDERDQALNAAYEEENEDPYYNEYDVDQHVWTI